jgi:dienelactone hydrolase
MAREGFIVLVPDAFLWGSRAFPIETLPETDRLLAPALGPLISEPGTSEPAAHYNAGAVLQEHIIAKYCTILGTSIAALVSYEDRMAAAYLRSRNDVIGERMGCVGLSGGGCRAALLQATEDSISAAVVAGMMCTYAGLLDHDVALHTWMFFPPGLSRVADWPDLAASRAPSPLLVQYALDDDLFTVEGMRAADARIGAFYESVGARGNYRGEFYPGPHRFDCAMQSAAFAWLRAYLTA